MARFKNTIKGYDKKEVDEFVHKNTEFFESKIKELQEHLDRLKEENDYLYAKNSEYRRNEERVSSAIIKAMEIKNKFESEFKTKLAIEEDRLNLFKNKWIAYTQGINKSNADRVLDDIDNYINEFKATFTKKINRDINIKSTDNLNVAEKSYLSEQNRLNNLFNKQIDIKEKLGAATILKEAPQADVREPDYCTFNEE